MEAPVAHISKDGRRHFLKDHLICTARLASERASAFGAEGWGYAAGLWHDLGKYSAAFQKYLARSNDKDHHVAETKGHVDHSTAGAQYAVRGVPVIGHLLAYIISGHHSGLLDGIGENACLESRLKKDIDPWEADPSLLQDQRGLALPDFLNKALASRVRDPRGAAFSFAFFTRMVFSCLADADFLDTEAFMDPSRSADRPTWPKDVIRRMEDALNRFVADAYRDTVSEVDLVRREVREVCLKAGSAERGFFSLTVPTGGGKTLSSLAFALRHAAIHGHRRIIYVAPFTSIIEQNADVFRRVFSHFAEEGLPDVVLEHHSDVDVENESAASRLAAENWDAPLVVTTSVQFYESLFANRSRRCRKLHNMADAVIVLDEAQKIPVDYLHPCLAALRELAANYRASIVLCTATQPAVGKREDFAIGLEGVREIVPDPPKLFAALRRVRVEGAGNVSDEEIAGRMRSLPQALCIVNTRKHAKVLFDLLRQEEGVYHLSAAMCPAHRSDVLKKILAALDAGRPCRVVSTQVVEAGIDVDFPVVFRALAGIDSIAQAAGRCNRNGRRKEGITFVFRSEHPDREVFLRDTANAAAQLMGGGGRASLHEDLLSPEAVEHYFRLYYWSQQNRWDAFGILGETALAANRRDLPFLFAFSTVSSRFRIIDDRQETVFVAWEEGADLCRMLEKDPFPDLKTLRRLQRFTVGIPKRLWVWMAGKGFRLLHDRYPVVSAVDYYYDKDTGLDLEKDVLSGDGSIA
jgi:CRISPR-associated endonuclease/helicase Cas3